MSNRFIRPDWITFRKGFRKRTEHRWAAEGGPIYGGPSEPGYVAVQLSPGIAVFPRATIEYYGLTRLYEIYGDDMEILAAEDLL